jgi:hypothetical protein
MLPLHQVEAFLLNTPWHLQEIVLELRNIIVSIAPDASEAIRWGGLSYFHDGKGGIVSAGICQIEIQKDHIRLSIIHGAFIDDKHHLLEGKQKYKRYVRIESYEGAPWEQLIELINSAARFDPREI